MPQRADELRPAERRTRFFVVLGCLALILAVGAALALATGVRDARLAFASRSGRPRALLAGELDGAARGWVAVRGCVRHDHAVVVSEGRVFAAGEHGPAEGARLYVPLSDGACDEAAPLGPVRALVEETLFLNSTLIHAYHVQVAPPPVEAVVDGVIGYGTANARDAAAARAALHLADDVPVLAKGRKPTVLWAAIVTATAGVHGLVLLCVLLWWGAGRWRRMSLEIRESEFADAVGGELEAGFFDRS